MSRIFKNSTFKMQLLVADDINTSIDGLSFKFHTTDPNIYVEVYDNFTLRANIATLTISSTLFSALDEGILTYEVRGFFNGEYVSIERQSNYFLKYSNSIPQVHLQEKNIGFNSNGNYEIYPDDGFDGMNKVTIDINVETGGGSTGGGDTGVINMADKGLRFFNFNGENLNGYDFSTVTDFSRFFASMPQLRSDINLTFNSPQSMGFMFESVASGIDEGIEINIDFNNQPCSNFSQMFNDSRLKRFPRFTNMSEETFIEGYRPFGSCHIHNFDNWQDFPWNKLRGEGGNCLFEGMDNLIEVPTIDLSNVEIANGMFGGCVNLERIEDLNFQNIGAFSWVFSNCPKLTHIGDLGNFENCWQFNNPFDGCPTLIPLPRMRNLKKNLNLSNMVQMNAGTAGLYLSNDLYDFASNGNKQDGEGILTVPAYFNNNKFWLAHREGIIRKGWTIEYV